MGTEGNRIYLAVRLGDNMAVGKFSGEHRGEAKGEGGFGRQAPLESPRGRLPDGPIPNRPW